MKKERCSQNGKKGATGVKWPDQGRKAASGTMGFGAFQSVNRAGTPIVLTAFMTAAVSGRNFAAFGKRRVRFRPLFSMKIFWLFLLVSTAAWAQPQPTEIATTDTAGRIIALETTPCRGTCPVQQLTVYADGRVRYVGQEHTERLGTYQLRLPKRDLARLQQCFRDARFFDFKTSYQAKVSDLPSTYLTFSDGGRTHTVLDYYGTPKTIKELEKEVLNLLKRKGWKKVEES